MVAIQHAARCKIAGGMAATEQYPLFKCAAVARAEAQSKIGCT